MKRKKRNRRRRKKRRKRRKKRRRRNRRREDEEEELTSISTVPVPGVKIISITCISSISFSIITNTTDSC